MNADPHRPLYHFTAPSHWLNDPNGIGFHGGRYHLHYQYNPHAAKWGDIHWGHATSADLVHWRDEPVSLAPTPGLDAGGCFSGSFALVNGVPTLYYTGFTAERQVQCVATSADLQHWVKHPERAIVEPPPGVEPHDFRDPYVFHHDGRWYMVVGASLDHARGQALLYRSDDGVAWEYRGALYTATDPHQGLMWECPNFFPLGDKWVLSVSLWHGLGVHAFVGRFENERFVPEHDEVLDVDAGAFAHLTMRGPDGRTLQWGWMNEQRDQAHIDRGGWAGAMSVPRELALDGLGRLTARPVAEIAALRGAPLVLGTAAGARAAFEGRHLDIEVSFTARGRDKLGLTLLSSPDGTETTRIVFWQDARRLSIERERSSTSREVRHQNVVAPLALEPSEPLHLRVLLDGSVLEVYANDRVCLSTRIYPTRDDSVHGTVFTDGPADVAVRAWTMNAILPAQRAELVVP